MNRKISIYSSSEASRLISKGKSTLYRWAEKGLIIKLKDPQSRECIYAFPFDVDDAITPKEASYILSKSLTFVYTLIRQGKLHKVFHEGKTLFLSKKDVLKYMNDQAESCVITSAVPDTEEAQAFALAVLNVAKSKRRKENKARFRSDLF